MMELLLAFYFLPHILGDGAGTVAGSGILAAVIGVAGSIAVGEFNKRKTKTEKEEASVNIENVGTKTLREVLAEMRIEMKRQGDENKVLIARVTALEGENRKLARHVENCEKTLTDLRGLAHP